MPSLLDIQTEKDQDSTPTPNPLAAMIFFFIVTSIYCVISIFMSGSAMLKLTTTLCYILFVITGQYFINLNLTHAMCGVRQWKSALFITFIPWAMIFGVLHLFLYLFPGWLSPFSNTFGYLVAKLMGLPDLMKIILVPMDKNTSNDALIQVSSDTSLLINQFSPENYVEIPDKEAAEKNGVKRLIKTRENFDLAWSKLQESGIIQKLEPDDKDLYKNETYRNKLYNFVQMKYAISEYVWNMLTGLFVTSISYNYILNTGCAKSPKEMKERYDKYQSDLEKKEREKELTNKNQPKYVQGL
jgi:hypothetical protein